MLHIVTLETVTEPDEKGHASDSYGPLLRQSSDNSPHIACSQKMCLQWRARRRWTSASSINQSPAAKSESADVLGYKGSVEKLPGWNVRVLSAEAFSNILDDVESLLSSARCDRRDCQACRCWKVDPRAIEDHLSQGPATLGLDSKVPSELRAQS